MPAPFLAGTELAGALYAEAVRPLLADRRHAAALLGWGSDVLGYDTARSTDHGWGPRLLVFVTSQEEAGELTAVLDGRLPERLRGWPVRYGWDAVEVTHHVTVTTLPGWLVGQLGVDATAALSVLDWLLVPQQRLLGVVAGAVYADDGGQLGRVRAGLAWYPVELWRWLLACQWHRLAQEEAFVARAAEVGDDTGSAVVAARLVRDMQRLALLMARRYAPYSKWLGTAFNRLPHPDGLPLQLAAAVHATGVADREAALAAAYTALAGRHNALGLTAPLDPATRSYYGRPADVLMAGRFADALIATLTDPELAGLPRIGSVDQVVDSTDVLSDPHRCRLLAGLYPVG